MDLLQSRMPKIRDLMRERDIDLLLAYSDGRGTLTKTDDLWCATGLRPVGETALLIPAEGEPILVVTPSWMEAEARCLKQGRVQVLSGDDFGSELRQAAKARVGQKKIGLSGRSFTSSNTCQTLSAAFEKELVDAGTLIQEAGRIREPAEIEAARKGAAIAESGHQMLVEACRAGMTEYELACTVSTHMESLGAEDNFQLVCSAGHNRSAHPPTGRRLEANDVVLAEISPCVDGVFVQICRTVVVGEGAPKNLKLLELGFQAGLGAVEAGNTVADVVEAVNGSFLGTGYEEYCHPPFMRVRGHGLGLGSVLPGEFTENNQVKLENGMMFVLHPNQYFPDAGYLMYGETVLVGERGPEVLTSRPHKPSVGEEVAR